MTDADSLVIVGVDVATVGSDQRQVGPMDEQLEKRCVKRHRPGWSMVAIWGRRI